MDKTIDYISWPGWEVVRLIGRGSFGAVYEIERNDFGHKEQAALKVISIPQNASDIDELYSDGYDAESITAHFQSYMKDIVNEYYLMADMKGHTNVVYCDDLRYVQHDDGIGWDIYIKMELLTPLIKVLSKDVSDEQVIRIGMDICNALTLCKDRNIVHRDIKPQNIFVSKDGNYKLGDFGIAKTAERTTSGTKVGTYKYMAPEVYNNQPYGAAADIYSLGLVMYWLLNERKSPFLSLSGSVPKASEEEMARERRFSGEQLPAPAHGSAELQAIVLKACAFAPKDRFASAQEMFEALESIGTVKKTGIPVVAHEAEEEETDVTSLPEQDEQTGDETETVGVFGRRKDDGQTAPVKENEDAEQTPEDADETVGVFGRKTDDKAETNGEVTANDADYLETLYDIYSASMTQRKTANFNESQATSPNTVGILKRRKKESISNLIRLLIGTIIVLIPIIVYPYVHIWTEATCTEPAKCKICGQVKGKPLGHQWEEATCTKPRYCKVCGELRGGFAEHQWNGSSHPKQCAVCGAYEDSHIENPDATWSEDTVNLSEMNPDNHTHYKLLGTPVVGCTKIHISFGLADLEGGTLSDKWALYGRNDGDWFRIDYFTYEESVGTLKEYTISVDDPISFDALTVVPYEWHTNWNENVSWSMYLDILGLEGYMD